MAKVAKPEHVLQHSGPAVKLAPKIPCNSNKPGSPRKRMAKQSGISTDRRSKTFGLPKGENMTEQRWKKVIAAIANGATRADAAKVAKISPQTVDAYLITNITAYKQIRDAVLLWNRRNWPQELVEKIFDDLALGDTLKGAAKKQGIDDRQTLAQLYRIVRKDRAIRELYDEARELQAESFIDDILDIADDTSADRLENGRVNREVVNRSKIKIDTRRFVMGAMVKKRFGDHKHVELEANVQVNHIALLTGARKRLESKDAKPEPAVIEGESKEIES